MLCRENILPYSAPTHLVIFDTILRRIWRKFWNLKRGVEGSKVGCKVSLVIGMRNSMIARVLSCDQGLRKKREWWVREEKGGRRGGNSCGKFYFTSI